MCRSPSLHARTSRAILLPSPYNGNRRDLSPGKFSSDTNYTNSHEMVGGVTPLRAEIVRHRRRAEDFPRYRPLSRFNGSRSVQFRQLAPEFAFAFRQLFRDVDLSDNVEIAAFP